MDSFVDLELSKLGKKKKTTEKSMPLGIKFLLIMILSCSLVGTGVCAALAVNDVYGLFFAVPLSVIAFVTLLFLLKDYKSEKKEKKNRKKKAEKTGKWYLDKFLAALVPVWVIAAIVLIISGYEDDDWLMYAGILMFPVISIVIAPNGALYALKDAKDWKGIFYGKGNLASFKDNKDFHWEKVPVSFEKRLFWAVVRDQILNAFALVALMVFGALGGLLSILTYDSHSVSPGDVIGAVRYVRLRRGTGVMAFILLIILVFGFPIFVYFVTNVIYKLRIVTSHKYMAYHAVVHYMNGYKASVNSDGRHYEYKYCTLVGMKDKDIHDTPAILIFIPDDVLIFPDEVFANKKGE